MNILIIGGNRFTGEAFANKCIFESHSITILNRSGTAGTMVDSANIKDVVKSDRDDYDYDGDWDICVDFCGYKPESVRHTLSKLNKNTLYVFISSGAVYCDGTRVNKSVSDKVGGAVAFDGYGIDKYECEKVVKELLDNYLIIRPPYILGESKRMVRLNKWASMIDLGLPIPIDGDGNACFSVVWSSDYVKIIYNLMQMAYYNKCKDRIYNVTSPEIYTTVGLVTELSRAMGKVANVTLFASSYEFKNYNYILESNVPKDVYDDYGSTKDILKTTYGKDDI